MARILVFAPHPDDAEIAMGGTIAALFEQGHDVLICDVTDGSPTPRGERAERLAEAAAATQELRGGPGAPAVSARGGRLERLLLDLPNRRVEHTLATRHALAGVIRAHQPLVIFAPEPTDAHPDHRAVTRSVEDARFDAKLTKTTMPVPPARAEIGPPIYARWLFHYDASHLRRAAVPGFLFDTTGYEQRKAASVRAYRSQFGPWPEAGAGAAAAEAPGALVTPSLPERLAGIGAYWGSRAGTASAEPFFTPEPLSLSALVALTGLEPPGAAPVPAGTKERR